MYRVSICDDNRDFLTCIEKFFLNAPYCEQYSAVLFDDPELFLSEGASKCEIAVLDIRLGKESGIRLAEEIKAKNKECQIIFVSDYISYATRVYEIEHVYYILKTELLQQFPKALEKAKKMLEKNRNEKIPIEQDGEIIAVRKNSILYVERNMRLSIIHCKEENYVVRMGLDMIAEQLGENFCRTHYSFLVDLEHTKSMTQKEIKLNNGESVPISRNRLYETKRAFTQFWCRDE